MPVPSPPLLTADLPGTAGALRRTPEDFCVEELPAYAPSGAGDHVFAWIEKRDVTTYQAIERMAAALGVRAADVGAAGLKDRHAVTRQFLSFPPPVAPDAVAALDLAGIRVLSAARHPHKLRTGHLRGNRFTLRVTGVDGGAELAAARARAILERLARPPGSPNWFGEQRFGARGDNAAAGRALLRPDAGARGGRSPRGRERRLLISAFQSELFNRYLARRIARDAYDRVLPGDVLQKVASGGLFASEQPEVDQPRLAAGEVVPTGPMYGHRMRAPTPDTAAAALEAEILAEGDISLADFARAGKLAEGTRRAIAVPLGATAVRPLPDGAIELSFELPAGAYATAVVREVVKPPDGDTI
jgi:tRNA pseudouridine13 synthase